MRFVKFMIGIVVMTLVTAQISHAQLSGSHSVGDLGMKSGSQGPPGIYFVYFFYNYSASEIVLQDGRELRIQGDGIDANAHVLGLSYISKKKILGGYYGATAFFPIINLAIEAPRVGLNEASTYGLGDMWLQPISLGWHLKQADVTAWYALYTPSGRFEAGASGNRGLGMWSHEFSLGTTAYFNDAKTFHASAISAWEFHSKKKDTDVKVGTLMTVEGGAGATFLKGGLDLGMAYYAQWKLTDDSGLGLPPLVENRLGKNHNYGIGPQVQLVLPLSKDLTKLMILDFKYLFEAGTKLDTKGDIIAFYATFKLR